VETLTLKDLQERMRPHCVFQSVDGQNNKTEKKAKAAELMKEIVSQ